VVVDEGSQFEQFVLVPVAITVAPFLVQGFRLLALPSAAPNTLLFYFPLSHSISSL
jgi:hypothetical protein